MGVFQSLVGVLAPDMFNNTDTYIDITEPYQRAFTFVDSAVCQAVTVASRHIRAKGTALEFKKFNRFNVEVGSALNKQVSRGFRRFIPNQDRFVFSNR